MRKTIFAIIGLFFLTILIVSSSDKWMKNITHYRFTTNSMLQSSRIRYGDLYALSYLPYFKKDIWKEKTDIVLDTCTIPRLIHLYCIGDSYLGLIPYDTVFCGVNKFIIKRANRVLACPRNPSKLISCPASMALSKSGITVSS